MILLGNRYCKGKITNSDFDSRYGGIFISRQCVRFVVGLILLTVQRVPGVYYPGIKLTECSSQILNTIKY